MDPPDAPGRPAPVDTEPADTAPRSLEDPFLQPLSTTPEDAPARRPWRALLARGARWAALGAGALVGFSVLWVGLYGLVNPPATALMLWERQRLGAVEQRWRPLEEISPHLRRAVAAAEDSRFCDHWGVDVAEMRRALRSWRAGGRLRGASTISQQTAKNVFLWSGRSWVRKGLEFWFTGLIELFWSKARILEVYLNVAEFGPGVFGAEAAAQAAFGRSADRLTIGQASRLAAVLPNPRARDPNALGADFAPRLRNISVGAGDLAASGRDRCLGID